MEEWSEADRQLMRESPDGGTTATVIALVAAAPSCTPTSASSAMLGWGGGGDLGTRAPHGLAARPPPTAPCDAASECMRRERCGAWRDRVQRTDQGARQRDEPRRVRPRPGEPARPPPPIRLLRRGAHGPRRARRRCSSSARAATWWRRAERLPEVYPSLAPKNARGELPAVLLAPEEEGFEPQNLAMTRSLGDFLMQVSRDAAVATPASPVALLSLISPPRRSLPAPPGPPAVVRAAHEARGDRGRFGRGGGRPTRRITLVVAVRSASGARSRRRTPR